jgi:2-polyprenyl-3-methyl-5-hydroxy-6-metoxy-1,4-benzoquinol methylase
MTEDGRLAAEQAHHDEQYRYDGAIAPDTRRTFRETITPAHLPAGTPRGAIHLRAYDLLQRVDLRQTRILDYACGPGHWAVHLASLGAEVSGFDLSPVGIERARRRAAATGVSVDFQCAHAGELPFDDESFDVAVGIDALHHTIKYSGTNSELLRVLRPGGTAIFTENLGDNPAFQWLRKITMRGNDAGDVILTRRLVADWAAGFSDVQIEPYSFLMMAKRVWRLRPLFPLLQTLDDAIVRVPGLRRYCGECVIVLRK